jgi:Spherulation-specific family 4
VGSERVASWASLLENCHSYGRASVIGYVWTDYGEGGPASLASIESQINAWYSYYPGDIAGIFFDGVSDDVPGTSTSNQNFYRTLSSYVHTREGAGAEVVLNFGANPGSEWMLNSTAANNANIVVTFEGSYDTPGEDPYTAWTQASWEAAYPAHDFAALVYNAPNEAITPQPASACSALASQNIGYVYVGTWYDELPSYFSGFLADSFGGGC